MRAYQKTDGHRRIKTDTFQTCAKTANENAFRQSGTKVYTNQQKRTGETDGRTVTHKGTKQTTHKGAT